MVFVGNGTPEGDKRARRLNLKADALRDQTEAHIVDFYAALTPEELSLFRDYLSSYKRLRANTTYLIRFAALRRQLEHGVTKHPAHADVMQAGTKSYPTVDQLLDVVDKIEPLE